MRNDFYRLIPDVKKEDIKKLYDECLISMSKSEAIMKICQIYDLIFDQKIVENCNGIGDYMKAIHSLPQYSGKKFIDSIILLDSKSEHEVKPHSNTVVNNMLNKDLDLIFALKNEQNLLLKKMKRALDENNVGTYKNLVLALKEITGLIQKEEWTQKWSKYSCDNKEYISVWEQHETEIKNHRKFELEVKKQLYIDFGRDITKIYFNNKITYIKNSPVNLVTDTIISLLGGDNNIEICGDFNGLGITLLDSLRSKGVKNTCKTDLTIINDSDETVFVSTIIN